MNPYIGEIILGGWNFAPRSMALANGATMQIAQNTALFSLYGTTFGGDGRTTFQLPNLNGRSAIGWGTGPGLTTRNWGQYGGAESQTLTINNLPAHTHTMMAVPGQATSGTADGNALAHEARGSSDVPDIYADATPSIAMHTGCLANYGSNSPSPLTRMQPYQVINYCVALDGIYPSRP